MRRFFQFMAKNAYINQLAKKYGLRLGAKRFVAGVNISEMIQQVKSLNKNRLVATIDYLGEFVQTEAEARQATYMCAKAIKAIAENQLQSHVSVKLTSLGLNINRDLCMTNLERILEVAKENHVFVRIDMEDFSHCQETFDIFYELYPRYKNVGVVIQAYLYRSEQDVEELIKTGANLRLVKGAYKESEKVTFPNKKDVDENYWRLIQQCLLQGQFTAIATHDENMIEKVKLFVQEREINHNQFEFQMLYGIREDLQYKLVEEGYKVRIYVPFGTDWFGYYMRRLAERPANVWFILKNLVKS